MALEIGDLFFSIHDLLFLLGHLSTEPLILLRQSLNLLRLAITRVARRSPAWRWLLALP